MTDNPKNLIDKVDVTDVQGLVVRGFGSLHHARFYLLKIKDGELARARAYLKKIVPLINRAVKSTDGWAIQFAITKPGVEAFKLPPRAMEFSREFLEGMGDDVRAISLGDTDGNAPENWTWGPEVHALLMVYVNENHTFADVAREAELKEAFDVVVKDTSSRKDLKEHFGWRDGLSMPVIEGIEIPGSKGKPQESWTDAVRPGEFVLGYRNEYNCYTECPTIEAQYDPDDVLAPAPDGELKSLGLNGTYLVYREMKQDVPAFWRYLATKSNEPGHDTTAKAVALGSKMVGRHPSGTPMIVSKDPDKPYHPTSNTFTYTDDKAGLQCPVGAHIRRANPRDHLAFDRDPAISRVMVRKHQMVRRGRPYGPPFGGLDPKRMIETPDDGVDRGLHFICLVGHISRQFEFVQRVWINTPNFNGLFKDGDPISAYHRDTTTENQTPNDDFTCPATPVRRKYTGMPQFTQLTGGAYFFLPSLRVLTWIANLTT